MCPRLPMSMAWPQPGRAASLLASPEARDSLSDGPSSARHSGSLSAPSERTSLSVLLPGTSPCCTFPCSRRKIQTPGEPSPAPLTFCPSAAPGPTFRSESQAQRLLSTASHGLCPCDLGVAGSFPGVRPHISSWEGSFLRTPLSRPPPVGLFPDPSEPWHMTICDRFVTSLPEDQDPVGFTVSSVVSPVPGPEQTHGSRPSVNASRGSGRTSNGSAS